jgi:uncharacterized iron-regulated membrane protein
VAPTALTRAKPKILAVHRWLALVAGLFLMSQGLTGSLIAFRYELNRALHPGVLTVAPRAVPPSLGDVIKAAESALPGARVARVDYPRAADDAYILRLNDSRTGALSIAAVDQSGHVTRAKGIWSWPIEAAYQLHERMMAGEFGQRAVGFVGLSLVLLALSGLFYWWPLRWRFGKTLGQTVRPQLTRGRIARELHRAVGVVYALYLIMMATIGLTMAWEPWTKPLVGMALPVSGEEVKVPKKACAEPKAVDDDIAMAQSRRPGQAIKSVRFQGKGRIVAVYFQSRMTYPPRATDHVWLNACSATVLAMDDQTRNSAGDNVFDWALPIHSGEWLGLPGRLLSWSAALALTVMAISGYSLWIIRSLRRRNGRSARPVMDGS